MRIPTAANIGGRPRLPTAVHAATGELKRNAHRYADRAGELTVEATLGAPPSYFDKAQKAAWKEIVGRTVPGVLRAGDELIVELAVRLMLEMRDKGASFNKANQFVSVLAQLGLTPAGRSMIKDPRGENGGKPKSGFAALRAGQRAS